MSNESNGGVIKAEPEIVDNDSGGVVEAPMMKVKDIRAKYKGRDYADFAKPKAMGAKSTTKQQENGVHAENQDDLNGFDELNGDHEVAQQVMSLFKGALDMETNLVAPEDEKEPEKPAEPQLIEPYSVAHHNKTATAIAEQKSSSKKDKDISSETTPSRDEKPPDSGKDDAEQLKEADAKPAASFDESLDQFYDVLNDLNI